MPQPIRILLVEDDPGDVLLTKRALAEGKILNTLDVISDGAKAMEFLQRRGPHIDAERPDLILLDLSLPGKDGRDVLAEVKSDPELRSTPVVILTTSDSDQDVLKSYNLQANCYVTKPVDAAQFCQVVKAIQNFWITIVRLPPN